MTIEYLKEMALKFGEQLEKNDGNKLVARIAEIMIHQFIHYIEEENK